MLINLLPAGRVYKSDCKVPFPVPTKVTDMPQDVTLSTGGGANLTSRIRAFRTRKPLEIKAGISKVCTTALHWAAKPRAVIFGGGCSGNVSLSFSSNSRWSGSGCV